MEIPYPDRFGQSLAKIARRSDHAQKPSLTTYHEISPNQRLILDRYYLYRLGEWKTVRCMGWKPHTWSLRKFVLKSILHKHYIDEFLAVTSLDSASEQSFKPMVSEEVS